MDPPEVSAEEAQRLIHELELHQLELKLQNEELRQAQAERDAAGVRYFDFYDLAPVGYCTLSEQGQILAANLTTASLLGVTRGELIQQPITRFILQQDQDLYYLHGRQLLQAGGPQSLELRMVKGDGTPFWVGLETIAAQDIGGAPVLQLVLIDISQRKRAEAVMAARMRLLLLAQDHSLAELLQATLDESEALTDSQVGFYHFLEPDQVSLSLQAWSTNTTRHMCKAQGAGLHYPVVQAGVWVDCVHQRRPVIHNDYVSLPHRKGLPEGHAAVIRLLAVPVMRGETIVAVLGVGNKPTDYHELDIAAVESLADLAWDIAARKRGEEALEESERQLRLITDNIPAVVSYVSASDLRYRFVNKGFAELFGGSPESFQDRQVCEVLAAEAYARALPFINRARQGEGVEYEAQVPQRGELRWFNVTYIPRVGPQDTVESIIVLAIDITERKQAEAENRKLEAQNRQLVKSESLGRMAGAVAHHFNNQLQAVMGFVELALEALPQPCPVAAEFLSEALQSARKAAEVSGMMLTYVGQTSGRRETLDFSEACRRKLPLFQAVMPGHVTLESDWPFPGPRVSANANQLQQIVANLLSNACEAVEQASSVVHLSVSTALASDISERHRFPIDSPLQHSAYACLKVTDSGSGIAEQDIEKLFDPFFSTKFTGRGLGLPVVLGIVRAHEGVITVESEPGRGSIFRVYLPLTRDEICQPPTPATRPLKAQESGTVLVVDDERAIRTLAVSMLTRLGFSALAAQDGVEAVEVFRQHLGEIRCVVCDLTMPRMDGWVTITELRRIRPGIPVVLASGYAEEQVMNCEHPERPDGFLHKPYRQEQLYQAIRQALAQEPGDLKMGPV